MSLQPRTMKLTPQQNNIIPIGKFIATDESFLFKQPIDPKGESFPRQGKPLVPYGFAFNNTNPDFTYIAGGIPMAMNYNTLIYNKLTGFV